MKNSSIRSFYPASTMSIYQGKLRRKKIITKLREILLKKILGLYTTTNAINLRFMLKKSMHFGHSSFHPGMKKFIRGQVNDLYLLNLVKAYRYFTRAIWFLLKYAYQKKIILFVGTTLPAASFIATAAIKTKSFFVNVRWLGGMLTNWGTLKNCIAKFKALQSQRKLSLTKKERAARKKEKQRLEKYLKGMKMLQNLPHVVILISQTKDKNAALECRKLGISNFTLLDTDCDPRLADFKILANNDSASSIKFVLYYLAKAIHTGKTLAYMKKVWAGYYI